MLNNWSGDGTDEIRSRDLLMVPQTWATLDYMAIDNPSILDSKLQAEATRNGVAHGILVWFDAEIGPGRSFSNGPQKRRFASVYGRGFFPLQEPVNISLGDIIDLTISAEYQDGDYEWTWQTNVFDSVEKEKSVASFLQSTLIGV
jgi:protein arginine N-methyltransferase 1